MRKCLCLLSFVLCLTAGASHIEETIHLSKGWNAIYLESTPDELSCADFFAGSPVVSVGCYDDSAYESTAQYRSDGTEINQKPVTYSVWFADEEKGSALRSLFGGRSYLVYATNNWTKTFLGIPAQPQLLWRKADLSGEGFMNLAGVSCSDETTAAAYFGPGPFGAKGTVYQIGGLNESAPAFLPVSFGSKVTLKPGLAYAVTSERADDWPGVIRVGGTGPLGVVDFETTERRTSFTVANASATDRTFSLVCGESADANEVALTLSRMVRENPLDAGSWVAITNGIPWTLDLKAGESATVQLALDRANVTDTNTTYGSVIEVRDENGSQMRVRVPLTACADAGANRTTGLWIGSVLLDRVSTTNGTPAAAQGKMRLTALLHVGGDGKARLLPQVVVAPDTNQVMRIYASLSDVPERLVDGARRITGGMMSLSNTVASPAGGFGTYVKFPSFVVGKDAKDNPFRHVWHPDHANTGADGIAVTNDIQFVWKEGIPRFSDSFLLDGDADWLRGLDDPDGVTAGYVVWKMTGLTKDTLTAVGQFALQRVIVGELEK